MAESALRSLVSGLMQAGPAPAGMAVQRPTPVDQQAASMLTGNVPSVPIVPQPKR